MTTFHPSAVTIAQLAFRRAALDAATTRTTAPAGAALTRLLLQPLWRLWPTQRRSTLAGWAALHAAA